MSRLAALEQKKTVPLWHRITARSGKHQHGLVVRKSAIQDSLENVVDHALVPLNHRLHMYPLDGPSGSGIQVLVLLKVVGKEIALKLGARYGFEGYAPPGVDLSAFGERGWLL